MSITAAQVMTPDVLTVSADLPIDELATFFARHGISGAPVTGDDGLPIGVVSLSDLARSSVVRSSLAEEPHELYVRGIERYVASEEAPGYQLHRETTARVRDIMTPDVFSLDESTAVQDIAQAMLTGRIHRVFVTRSGRIVGIVSAMDLLPLVRDLPAGS